MHPQNGLMTVVSQLEPIGTIDSEKAMYQLEDERGHKYVIDHWSIEQFTEDSPRPGDLVYVTYETQCGSPAWNTTKGQMISYKLIKRK